MRKTGKCAICGSIEKLCFDHIPPKCCGNTEKSYYISFTPDYLGITDKYIRPKISQNGIKFETICEKCNSILGSKYDEELLRFKEYVLNKLNKEKTIRDFDLNKVIKALVGHLLAASQFDNSVFARMMRTYYFDKNKELLEKCSLIVCFYPYIESIFILKNYVPLWIHPTEKAVKGVISSMYFFPFAIILCDKQKLSFGNDLFEAVKAPLILKFSYEDWINKLPTWPAVIDEHHAFIVSEVSKNSVYKA